MADMKMTLMTKDGDTITSSPGIMNFFMSNDGTLSIILESPLDQPFRFASTDPDIGIAANGGVCTIPGDGSVIVTVGNACSFRVASATGATITSVALPGGSFSNGIYQWTPTSNDLGTYLAVFQADAAGTSPKTSQIVVMIKVNPAETVSTPGTPSGTTSGTVNTTYTYTTAGATSSLGHTVQYRFNWGGENYSDWSTSTSATKSWSTASTYSVTVEARCQQDTSVSSVSSALSVNIASAPAETISTPGTPSGTTSGTVNTTYTYTTTGATSSSGHTVQYRFNWGGGNYSSWSTSTSATKSWSTASTYSVTVEAQCQTHPSISSVSSALSVTISSQAVTPSGDAWPWETYPTFNLNAGEEKVYIVNINKDLMYLKLSIAGLNENTKAVFSWTFPDGSVYPQALNQGVVDIDGMNFGGLLVLRSKKYWYGGNINHDYIPQGNHVLRIKASAASYFKAMIDAY
jgi:hypothetical protein